MLAELFLQIAVVIVTAGLVSLVAYRLRQPLIIAYIVTGLIIGPSIFGFSESLELFQALSTVGIAFLLFIVGLNLNWRTLAEVGKTAVALGLLQVLVTAAAGTGLALLLKFELTTALILGLALSFSSTIIIVKLLSDQEDLDRFYGRLTMGLLIMQDLVAMVALLLVSALGEGGSLGAIISVSLFKAVAAVLALFLLAKFIVPHLFRYAAKSTELLFLLAIAWCFAVAAALQLLGFSLEIGALLAGVSLAGTGFQHEIESKVRVLRDFFLIIFFIVLGTQFVLTDLPALVVPLLVLGTFVLIGKPLIVFVLMRCLGQHPRSSFLTSSTTGQVSEFSFILLVSAMGAVTVHEHALSLLTFVGLISIAGSSYLIRWNEEIFDFLARYAPWLQAKKPEESTGPAPQVVMLGCDRMGLSILPKVQELTDRYLVVDYDPAVIEALGHEGIPALYGDVGSEELLHFAQSHKANLVISTVPDMQVNADVVDFLRHKNFRGSIILTAKSSADAARCYELGATFVIVPSILGGERFAELLKKVKTGKSAWGSIGKKAKQELIDE